jgi:response regulator RpfG family c-di-GMP phosphodiesterase
MRNPEALVQTQTVFLYEQNSDERDRMLAELTKQGFRVLCLEYLVQVLKRSQDIEPDLILCNPGVKHESLYDNLLELRKTGALDKYPFFVYGISADHPWADRFIEAGIHNLIQAGEPPKEIARILRTRERINRKVEHVELVSEEKQTADGTSYWYLMPKARTQPQLTQMLEEAMMKILPIHIELVVLRLEFLQEISSDNLEYIFSYSQALLGDGVRLMVVGAPTDAMASLFSKEIACFPSMLQFDASFLGQARKKANLDVSSLLDSIPD